MPRQTCYTGDARWIRDALFARQIEILPDRAASAFRCGLDRLKPGRGSVVDYGRLSSGLGALTGWSAALVPMLTDPVFADYIQEYGHAG